MAVLIRVNHHDEPYPVDQAWQLLLAERASQGEYVLKHPLFRVELRARQVDGKGGQGKYYCPDGDYQLRVCDRPWPTMNRWLGSTDLVGDIHTLGFDLQSPRHGAARETFRQRVQRKLRMLGIEDTVRDG